MVELYVICGAPQGTTLSHTLFNIHINQLNYLNTHGKLVCYADDTVPFVEGQSWYEVFASIEMCHNLKWKNHIQYITNKLRKLMYAFKTLTDILEFKTIIVVHQALIESIISYGISIWGGTYDITIDP
ncbi:zinc finger and BTB domain-containing protein 14-like [Aphis craccivora]|uniref:Zinc finger and BTB domain-containing protein 14-like n=1 Tax=Aphis craccivora TaxID=307492 RepID=A0A6G0YXV2_APHCR|nr:zinc finger and BTB domain-containing protein 14-like [Aphis craccivora]